MGLTPEQDGLLQPEAPFIRSSGSSRPHPYLVTSRPQLKQTIIPIPGQAGGDPDHLRTLQPQVRKLRTGGEKKLAYTCQPQLTASQSARLTATAPR